MKKFLIFAVIAAMFATVFPACGKDDDSGGAASPPEVQLVYDKADAKEAAALNAIIVTWTGAAGYDYDVYFERRNLDGVITALETNGVKGQTLYALKVKETSATNKDPITPFWEIDTNIEAAEETLWSLAISSASNNHYYFGAPATVGASPTNNALNDLFTKASAPIGISNEINPTLGATPTGSRTVHFRVGVAAANPGGYPIAEKRTVVYSDWF